MTDKPDDATGTYRGKYGTWAKDLDCTHTGWPMARLWSVTTGRWRKKREKIVLGDYKPLPKDAP